MWGQQQKKLFQTSKKLLMSSQLLVHFNPDMELILTHDASTYRIGAVLSHKMPDGTEYSLGNVSCTLTKSS